MDTNDVATNAGGTGLTLGDECALFPPPCELVNTCPPGAGDPLTAELLGEGVKLCGKIPYVLYVAAYAALTFCYFIVIYDPTWVCCFHRI
jgi:hypothetical protein